VIDAGERGTKRLNLGDVERLDAQVMDAVRGVVRDWRASREGDFRLDLTTPISWRG
jgi:hypothetical protein